MGINYYKLLQVDQEAETDVIEAAYKRLALKYHPDVNKSPDAESKMKSLNEARKILTNPQKRKNYDEQFGQSSQSQSSQNYEASKPESRTDEDIWDETATRNLAAQILVIAQRALNEKKWRIAKEKLYAFEGLGIPSNGGPLPTFPSSLPEWGSAKKMDELANQQSNQFLENLKKRFFILDGIVILIGIFVAIVTVAGAVAEEVSHPLSMGGAICFGILLGIPILIFENIIFAGVYTKQYAGKLGENTDYILGLLMPFGFWMMISLMATGVGCLLLPPIFAFLKKNKW